MNRTLAFFAVVAAACAGPHPGNGNPGLSHPSTAFAAPTDWTTPPSTWAQGYFVTSGAFSGTANWSTFDIDGDGRPDLVVTTDVTAGSQLGWPTAPYWQVYRNTGHGFATTATQWPTPSAGAPGDLGYFQPAVSGFSNTGAWSTVDIDGDGRVDLVVTSAVGFPGTTGWQVFHNTGAGFATTATTWATPSLGWSFSVLSGGFSGTGIWSTFDIDGDARPDLVVTADLQQNAQLGWPSAPRWDVYRNNGAGFDATATAWPTPSGAGAGDLGYFRPDVSGFANTGSWSTVDLDGDGRVDLVVTAQEGSQATASWSLFRNTGHGFATTATDWALPTDGDTGGFTALSGAFTGTPTWSTFDIDADGRPDLVITEEANAPAQPGWPTAPYWNVYKNSGSGFALTATQFKTPATGSPGDLGYFQPTITGFANTGAWTTMDLDGDGRLDLVTTQPVGGGEIGLPGAPSWSVSLGM